MPTAHAGDWHDPTQRQRRYVSEAAAREWADAVLGQVQETFRPLHIPDPVGDLRQEVQQLREEVAELRARMPAQSSLLIVGAEVDAEMRRLAIPVRSWSR